MNIELTRDQYRKLLVLAHLGEHVVNAPAEQDDEEALNVLSHLNSFSKTFDSTDLVDPQPYQEDGRYYGTRDLDEQVLASLEQYDEDIFWNELAENLAARDLEGQAKKSDEEIEEYIQERVEFYTKEFESNGIENFKLKG